MYEFPAHLSAPRADELIQRYAPGASLFCSPDRTLLAQGVQRVLPTGPAATLGVRAAAFLTDCRRAGMPGVLLGAVPFQSGRDAHLFVPDRVSMAGASTGGLRAAATECRAAGAAVCVPSPQAYRDNVSTALARIHAGDLRKVVLSRSLKVDTQVDLGALLRCLVCRNPRGYTYAIELDKAERHTLVGASPELLLARRGRRVMSNPLAGSIPRVADAVEDARRAEALLSSAKDLYEHALVVDSVAEILRPFCRDLVVPAQPSLLSTPTMWHLSSVVSGELVDPAVTSLDLATRLHPTPAVCGYPTPDASAFIDEVEGFDRGFFTGLVGWCDAEGDGEWAVTIRCAEIRERSATLYAGAGIVDGSDPAKEVSAKLRTMLSAMGLDAALQETLEACA